MNCPSDIAEIVTSIIQAGILNIRAFGGAGDCRRCAIEADHIHNLPDILGHYSQEQLKYYWEVERPSFMSQVGEADLAGFEPLWNKLECHVAGEPEQITAP